MMEFYPSPLHSTLLALLLLGSLTTAGLGVFAWQNRSAPASLHFFAMMVFLTIWQAATFMARFSETPSAYIYWIKLGYIGLEFVPIAWLLFAAFYSGYTGWIKLRRILVLLIPPMVFLAAVWGDIFWTEMTFTRSGNHLISYIVFSDWLIANTIFDYTVILIGSAFILFKAAAEFRKSRLQASFLLAAVLLPLFTHFIYLQETGEQIDLTPVSFAFSGILLGFALFRYHLFSPIPVARQMVIESMAEGIIILDPKGNILDMNRSALQALGKTLEQAAGKTLSEILPLHPNPTNPSIPGPGEHLLRLPAGSGERIFQVKTAPLTGKNLRLKGHLVSLHEITQSFQVEENLLQRLEREKLFAHITHLFINIGAEQVDAAVSETMQLLGEFAGADRSYFRRLSTDGSLVVNAWDWESKKAAARTQSMRGLNLTKFDWSTSQLKSGRILLVKNIRDLPPEAAPEKELWQSLYIVSVIMVPIFTDHGFVGVIGLNTEQVEREWTQEDARLLTLVGEILVNTLENRLASQALKDSEARYRRLVENSPIPFLEEDFSQIRKYLEDLHRQGITNLSEYLQTRPEEAARILGLIWIVEVNQANLDLFEIPSREEVVGRHLIAPVLTQPELLIRQVEAIDRKQEYFSIEGLQATTRQGKKLVINLTWVVLPGYEHDWSRVLVTIIDVTESRRKDEFLRSSERKYHALVDAIPDLVYRIHRDGTYLEVLPSKNLSPLYSPDTIIGRKVFEILPEQDARRRMELIQLALDTNEVQVHEFSVIDEGTKRYSEGRIVACGEDEIMLMIRDITDRVIMEAELRMAYLEMEKRVRERTTQLEKTNIHLKALIEERLLAEKKLEYANERLTALSKKLIEIQESEKRLLAHELHDQIGQLLTGLQFSLENAKLTSNTEARVQIIKSQNLVTELMTDVRNLALSLRPRLLDDMGILPALLWYFNRYSDQTQMQVHFTHSGLDQRFFPDVETSVFRIVQEALTNAARYSSVSEVHVRLWADESNLQIQVEDHGAGYDLEKILKKGNTGGIVSMQERINWLNGQLHIQTSPGLGTRIIADIPLEPQEDKIE